MQTMYISVTPVSHSCNLENTKFTLKYLENRQRAFFSMIVPLGTQILYGTDKTDNEYFRI
jgi:hypothetical protein